MPKPKSIIHALVLWGRTAEDKKNGDTEKTYDVIELSSIPRKFRKEGATPMLKWMDKRTEKASMNKATIVKISDKIEELQRMSVIMTGSVSDSNEKLFGNDVMQKRKDLQKARRKTKIVRTTSEDCNESEILENSTGRSEDEEIDEANEDEASRQQRFMTAMKELASQVTEENIRFLESLVKVMKESRMDEKKPEIKSTIPYEIPDFYTTPGRGKVPIWEGMNFYFYEAIKNSIETKSHVTDKSTGERLRHWPLLVRLALVEIYGKKLADHSAKGSKSGSRPAIDHRLFRAIHYWASDWVGHELDMDAYVEHINKTCYNKRKGTPQDIKRRIKKSITNHNTLSLPIETVTLPDYSQFPSFSGSQTIKDEHEPMETHVQSQSTSNNLNSPRTSQFSNSLWDTSDCNFSSLV